MRRLLPPCISITLDEKSQERVPTEGFIPMISFERGHSLFISIRGEVDICQFIVASGLFHVVNVSFGSIHVRLKHNLPLLDRSFTLTVFQPALLRSGTQLKRLCTTSATTERCRASPKWTDHVTTRLPQYSPTSYYSSSIYPHVRRQSPSSPTNTHRHSNPPTSLSNKLLYSCSIRHPPS